MPGHHDLNHDLTDDHIHGYCSLTREGNPHRHEYNEWLAVWSLVVHDNDLYPAQYRVLTLP